MDRNSRLSTPKRLSWLAALAALSSAALFSAALVSATPGQAAGLFPRGGQVLIPESSVEDPSGIGTNVHTHLRSFQLSGGMSQITPPRFGAASRSAHANASAPYSGYFYVETPASLACIYNLVATSVAGCNPYATTAVASGGSRAIAVVEAYDDPSALTDLNYFSAQFGLAAPTLQVAYASGYRPPFSRGWALEAATDLEMAHAMAPNAKLILVEAASTSLNNLMTAVTLAGNLVAAAGGGEVSISWGSSEFAGETNYDGYFVKSGVVFVVSAGDSTGVQYPAASPNVVSVGGTSLSRNPSTGNFQQELSWQQTGGGPSGYEPRPSYQAGIASATGSTRGVPDVAAVADPTTGVWVFQGGAWSIIGGTSVAAPLWAGIINAAGQFKPSSASELATIYGSGTGVNTIVNGDCGPYEGYLAVSPWSFCAGLGSPNGAAGK